MEPIGLEGLKKQMYERHETAWRIYLVERFEQMVRKLEQAEFARKWGNVDEHKQSLETSQPTSR